MAKKKFDAELMSEKGENYYSTCFVLCDEIP